MNEDREDIIRRFYEFGNESGWANDPPAEFILAMRNYVLQEVGFIQGWIKLLTYDSTLKSINVNNKEISVDHIVEEIIKSTRIIQTVFDAGAEYSKILKNTGEEDTSSNSPADIDSET